MSVLKVKPPLKVKWKVTKPGHKPWPSASQVWTLSNISRLWKILLLALALFSVLVGHTRKRRRRRQRGRKWMGERRAFEFSKESTLCCDHTTVLCARSYRSGGSWLSLCKLWLQNPSMTLRASHRSRLFCGYLALSGCFRSKFCFIWNVVHFCSETASWALTNPTTYCQPRGKLLTYWFGTLPGAVLGTTPSPQISFGLLSPQLSR